MAELSLLSKGLIRAPGDRRARLANKNKIGPLLPIVFFVFALLLSLGAAQAAWCGDNKVRFQIPPSSADRALNLFALQADIQLLYPFDLIEDLRLKGLTGTYTVDEGIKRLITGTCLEVDISTENNVILSANNRGFWFMKNKNCKKPSVLSALSAVIIASISASPASGQETPRESQGAVLEEIIVTAERRARSIQDIPIAITALSADSITKNRLRNATDLNFVVPGITFSEITGNTLFSIRGIGTNLGQSAVAVYVDGVPSDGLLDLLGLERVEVLKGPQGTYFGTTAVAGAVSYITHTPSQETEGSLTLTGGNYDLFEGSGYFSSGITEDMSVGVYFASRRQDSIFARLPVHKACINVAEVSRCEPEDEEEWGLRLKAVYEPSDFLKITASAETQRLDSFDAVAFRQLQHNATGFALGAPVVIDEYVVTRNSPQFNKRRKELYILRADLNFDSFKFSSLSGYRQVRQIRANDIDATSAPLVGTIQGESFDPTDTYTQELQLLSSDDSSIDWVTGLFFENAPQEPDFETVQLVAGAPSPLIRTAQDSTSKTYAVFGQAIFSLDRYLQGASLTLGARYTEAERTLRTVTFLQTLGGTNLIPPIYSPSTDTSNEDTFYAFTPKIAFDYKFGDSLIYASYAKGFVPGTLGSQLGISPVDPETLNAFEIGVKSDLNAQIRLNASTYFYDYADSQLTAFVVTESGATGTKLVNTEGVESYGAELELTAAVSLSLTLSGSLSYNHASYKDESAFASFVASAAGNTPTPVDITDNQAIRAPEWSANMTVDFTHPLGDIGALDFHGSYHYSDSYPWDPAGLFDQESLHMVIASMSFVSQDDKWRVGIWGRNLLDEYQEASVLTTGFGTFATDAPPRTYGVSLTYNLN